MTPSVVYWSAQRFADVPLAAALLASATGLAALLNRERVAPVLVGSAVGFSAAIKQEGLLVTLLFLAVFAWTGARARVWPNGRMLLELAAGLAPGLLALAWFRLVVPQGGVSSAFFLSNFAAILEPARWAAVAAFFGREASPLEAGAAWGLGWIALALGTLCASLCRRGARRAHQRFLGISAAGALVGYWLIFVITPMPQQWHLDQAFERFLLQVYPLLLVAVIVWLAGPETEGKEMMPSSVDLS